VPTTLTRYDATMHEFFGLGAVIPKGKQGVARAAAGLRGARARG